jgi:hypothetical protein
MSMLRKITKVQPKSAVAVKNKVCVGGVRYALTLECGHELDTKVYARGTKHTKPEVGKRKQCPECIPEP